MLSSAVRWSNSQPPRAAAMNARVRLAHALGLAGGARRVEHHRDVVGAPVRHLAVVEAGMRAIELAADLLQPRRSSSRPRSCAGRADRRSRCARASAPAAIASSILSTCSWSSTTRTRSRRRSARSTNSAAGASWYIGTGMPPSACAASIDQYRRGRLSPMIARCMPAPEPLRGETAGERAHLGRRPRAQVHVCQMPRSFSRQRDAPPAPARGAAEDAGTYPDPSARTDLPTHCPPLMAAEALYEGRAAGAGRCSPDSCCPVSRRADSIGSPEGPIRRRLLPPPERRGLAAPTRAKRCAHNRGCGNLALPSGVVMPDGAPLRLLPP